MRRAGIVLLLALLSGCAAARSPYPLVKRGTYVYQRMLDGRYLVSAADVKALDQAMREICGNKAICIPERNATLYIVSIIPK